jgi:hypothetical protein
MYRRLTLYSILTLIVSSCFIFEPKRLLQFKDKYIWRTVANQQDFSLIIDDSKDIWFSGRLIIDNVDTLYLRGFEKGSNHPTTVYSELRDTIYQNSMGSIFLWKSGRRADSILVTNEDEPPLRDLPGRLTLYKNKKY